MQAVRCPILFGLTPKTFHCEKKLPLDYKCKECAFASDLKAILGLHVNIKHKKRFDNPILERPFKLRKCAICDFETFSMLALTGHVYKLNHVVNDGGWFTCSHCEFATKIKKILKSHFVKKHPQTREWFECEQCVYKAARITNLKRHVFLQHVHTDKYKFQCKECSYKCNMVRNLKTHCSRYHEKSDITPIETKRGLDRTCQKLKKSQKTLTFI